MKLKFLLILTLIPVLFACHAPKEKSRVDSIVRSDLAKTYIDAGNFSSAMEQADKAVKLDPENSEAWFMRAEILARSGKFEEAFKSVEQGATHLNKERLYKKEYWNGAIYYHQGQLDRAREAFKISASKNPGFTGNYVLLGQIYTRQGMIKEAIESYLKWTELEPKSDRAWSQLGIAYAVDKQYDKAKEALENAIKINPKDSLSYKYLGTLAEEQDRFEEAESNFAKSISLNDRDPYNNLNMGQLLMIKKRPKEALPFLQKALELEKGNMYALFWLGKYHHEMKEYPKAVEFFEQAIAAAPSFWAARNGMAEAAMMDGSLIPRAVKTMEEGLERDPGNRKGYYYYLARLKLAQKDPAAALQYADKASALIGESETLQLADSHLLRGMIFDALSRKEEAVQEYKKAASLAPKTMIAKEAQRRIKG